jgi:hypothetical protein
MGRPGLGRTWVGWVRDRDRVVREGRGGRGMGRGGRRRGMGGGGELMKGPVGRRANGCGWGGEGKGSVSGGHTGTRNSYFNTLDFLKENVEFSYRIYTVNAHILFCFTARSLNIFF